MKSFLLLALALLTTPILAQEVNMIWASTGVSSPQCRSCLDQIFLSCPGNYQTVSYAQCMCAGDGSASTVTCAGVCERAIPGRNLGNEVAGAWYNYCTVFFKELCPDAKEFMDEEFYNKRCGPDSGPGLADVPATGSTTSKSTSTAAGAKSAMTPSVTSDGSSSAATESPSVAVSVSGVKATSTTSKTATSTGISTSTATNAVAGVSNLSKRWGVMVGLGVGIVGMNI